MIRFRHLDQQKLDAWLAEAVSRTPDGRYALRLLTENVGQLDAIWDELAGYVNEAHQDAQRKLNQALAPTLSPFIDTPSVASLGYPGQLHVKTLLGYLGEVMAGLVAEHKDINVRGPWRVPAFLFRFHQLAFQKLSDRQDLLQQGLAVPGADDDASIIPGRTGNDVLAFERDKDGAILSVLVCEAKCLTMHIAAKAREAHEQLSKPVLVPSGVRELIDILSGYDTDEATSWRDSLRRLLFDTNAAVVRMDMLFYATGNVPVQQSRSSWLPSAAPLSEYTGKRSLEVVEVHLTDPRSLVERLYRSGS